VQVTFSKLDTAASRRQCHGSATITIRNANRNLYIYVDCVRSVSVHVNFGTLW